MKILINAVSAHMGGSVTYLQNLLPILSEVAPRDLFYVYVPKTTRATFREFNNVRLRMYPFDSTQGVQRFYFDQMALPRIIRKMKIDVLLSSSGFGSFFVPCKQLLLIRNMVYFSPQFHETIRNLGQHSLSINTVRRWYTILSIQRSNAVIFPSLTMKKAVADYLSMNGKMAEFFHYGYKRTKSTPKKTQAQNVNVSLIKEWKNQGYVILLNVSTYAIHKNFETLIEALQLLTRRNVKVKLITTTSRIMTSDINEYDHLKLNAKQWGLEEHWLELGYIPNKNLDWLYELADIYVFPSFIESFGHSMVEAMGAGLPVVAASSDINQEICGEAGIYFETFSALDCAKKIAETIEDKEEHTKRAPILRLRANQFSWNDYGQKLADIFHSL